METVSPVVLKCAVCSFESEIILDFQSHCCSNMSENNNDIQPKLKDMVPREYLRYISTQLQNTYVFSSEKEADSFRKTAERNEDVAVMVFDKSKPLYSKVEANLSDRGKEFVQNTEAWVVNLLLDWCDQFEQVICRKTSKYETDNSIDSTKTNVEGKADVPSTNHSSVWSKVATSYLIELHTVHSEKFLKPSMKKKEVWKIISSEMNNKGFPFTLSQCEQKWKNLTKAYRDCVDHNSKSGNERKECPFFKELEDCYGYRPNVKPLFTLGTRKEDDTESTDTEESAAGSTSNDCDVAPKRKKKNKPNEIVVILDDMRKEHREMMKTLKDQHEKRMENEQRKIEIMSQLVEAMKNQ